MNANEHEIETTEFTEGRRKVKSRKTKGKRTADFTDYTARLRFAQPQPKRIEFKL